MWCHVLVAPPPLQSAAPQIFEHFLLSENFSPPRLCLQCVRGERRLWCRWACGRCASVGALCVREKSAEVDSDRNRRSMFKDCTPERRSGCPEPVSMRLLLSLLYPVLSLTVFGLYPSMVSYRLCFIFLISVWHLFHQRAALVIVFLLFFLNKHCEDFSLFTLALRRVSQLPQRLSCQTLRRSLRISSHCIYHQRSKQKNCLRVKKKKSESNESFNPRCLINAPSNIYCHHGLQCSPFPAKVHQNKKYKSEMKA